MASDEDGPDDMRALADLLRGRAVVALTGAGCSTESGIPDYRGPETSRRTRNPIRWQDYARDPETRARYWARSTVGWPRIATARPNPAHDALSALESAGIVRGVLTQNVDRLHHAAGSRRVVELHGALADVRCMACATVERRADVQARLLAANPGLRDRVADAAPDGDAELPASLLAEFAPPRCLACGGELRPAVVFFGENVAPDTRAAAFALLGEGDALLVVGSSLVVFSGYRFVLAARERGMRIAVVNRGPTRGDAAAHVVLDARAGHALPALVEALATGAA